MISTLENGSVERIKLIMKPSAKTINKHVCRNIHRMLFPCLGDMIMKYYLSLYQRAQATTTANSKFELFPISSLLLYLLQFVKCWRIFSELNCNWAVSNFRKRKRKLLYCVHVLRKTIEKLGSFTLLSCNDGKKCTKKRDARAELFC